ncbi:MAG: AbrB/MazE/SpoVT family DNA-binding domain-containing protein [Gammaproteobacteria bacterium]|nr:AbrB/MazE/SpoVT family DNA-binding domain-containing protein [Gammaproteobacteria bacterium]
MPPPTSPHRQARLFRNGRNQAVRIPREFEMAADEVVIYREDHRLIIVPIDRPPSLADVLSTFDTLDENFLMADDPPTEPEDLL